MARIAGVDLPKGKRLEVALTYIYGIGRSSVNEIVKKTGVSPDIRVEKLNEGEISKLRSVIESEYKVEGSKRAEVAMNIKRLMDIGSYRGLRHRRNLPVRGQRTRTNARTKRGSRRTIGAKRKKK